MTFIEVVIAVFIASIVSIGLYGSAIYTARQIAANTEHIYALQAVNAAAARVRAANFDRMIAATLTGTQYETPFRSSTPSTITTDSNHPNPQTLNLTYEIKGFGRGVENISGSTADFKIPAHSAPWAANEFAGRFIVITAGRGAGQVMRIVSHPASTGAANAEKKVKLTLTTDLEGTGTGGAWGTTPNDTSTFAVDYGLYCDVTVSWGDGEGHRTIRETVYLAGS